MESGMKKNKMELVRAPVNLNLPNTTNGECYHLREVFSMVEHNQLSPYQFYKPATQNSLQLLLICSRSTLNKQYSRFKYMSSTTYHR